MVIVLFKASKIQILQNINNAIWHKRNQAACGQVTNIFALESLFLGLEH